MPSKAISGLPEPPPGGDEPVFAEPWQASAFALAVELNARGAFTWAEWAAALSAELRGAAEDGSDYYERWLAALERLLVEKAVTDTGTVADLTAAWHRAAEATPHGKPILLENDPLRRS